MVTAGYEVEVTINSVVLKLPQGRCSFQDIAAEALHKGAISALPVNKLTLTVVSPSAPAQNHTTNPNGSFAIQGGETFTLA
ncbi:MAG: hypothetical protein WA618_12900 [Terriglobales bacterium]